jgi:hypothetical protein
MTSKDYGGETTQTQQQPCKQSRYKAKTRRPEGALVKTAFKEAAVSVQQGEDHAHL